MPVVNRNPQELLSYNAAYRVLICRQCQFAIQKNAIASHLLRHNIYRKEKQRLLTYAAGFDLVDPDDVEYPLPGSPAINDLSVIPGYCCTKPGCGSLWGSIKRMQNHQREEHGERALANISSYARPVYMQTFFQGNKLRYFEVTDARGSPNAAHQSIEDYSGLPENDDMQDQEHQGVSPEHVSSRMSDGTPSQRDMSPHESVQSSAQSTAMDLEAMAYFRQYLIVTSSGLPAPYDEPQAWSISVVDHALKHQWLMCGLLALSAYNLAIISIHNDDFDKNGDANMHAREGNRFAAEFSKGLGLELVRQQILHGTDLSAISDRIHHLIKCASWSIFQMESRFNLLKTQPETTGLNQIVENLSSLAAWSCVPRSEMPDQEAIYSRAQKTLDFAEEDVSILHPDYLRLLQDLKRLPTELSDALGRPDRVKEVLATLAAISSLVVCCEMSYDSETKEAAWHGMIGWLTMLSRNFQDMLVEKHPAALVLLEHWITLVYRAHSAGFWFLDHVPEIIYHSVHDLWPHGQSDDPSLVKAFTI